MPILPGSIVVIAALGLRALAILDEPHRAARQPVQRQHQLRGRHVGPILALGPAEMRQQQHDRAAVAQFEHGRQHRPQPRVVGDLRAVHRHVEVDADQHPLAGQVLRQVVEGLEVSSNPVRSTTSPSTRSASEALTAKLGHRRGGVDHAVREAPFIVVPADDADQLALDHRGFEAVDGRAVRACA